MIGTTGTNYNHLHYFWLICKMGSVSKAAAALALAPQTLSGQIRLLEARAGGALLVKKGRSIEPSELGRLVYKYADKMFMVAQELNTVLHDQQEEGTRLEVGVADALSKRLVSRILLSTLKDHSDLQISCYESTHEKLLEQLKSHQLDMLLSDCPVDSTEQPGVISKKLGESEMAFYCREPLPSRPFPSCLEERPLLIPGRRTAMGRQLQLWLEMNGLSPKVLGEFDDAAMMKAFGFFNQGIFIAPTIYADEILQKQPVKKIGSVSELKEGYYIVFTERMIQHPAVKALYSTDFTRMFKGEVEAEL